VSAPEEEAHTAVQRHAEALMDALGTALLGRSLQGLGWTFGFDGARVRLGQCVFRRGRAAVRRITVSRLHAAGGWTPEVEDTVRHEIAHAVDYERRGRSAHDTAWRALALRCGATPRACTTAQRLPDAQAPYIGRCGACGAEQPFYRVPVRTYRCRACRQGALVVVNRRTNVPVQARAAYVGRCPSCQATQPFARRPRRRYACAACCRAHAGNRFDARFMLRVTRVAGG
jgi:hypothetical protein